jgi:nitrogen fixation protein FixH
MTRTLLGLIAALAISSPALAQGSGHAHHGGQAVKIGKYEVELVVKGPEVTAYVLDEQEKKVDASTVTASAVVLAKGNQQKVIDFKPGGDNKLTARYDFPIEGRFRAVLTLKTKAGEAGKGRYNLNIGR